MPVDSVRVKYVIMLSFDLTDQKTTVSLVYSMKPIDNDYEDIEYQPLGNYTALIKSATKPC